MEGKEGEKKRGGRMMDGVRHVCVAFDADHRKWSCWSLDEKMASEIGRALAAFTRPVSFV